MKINFNINNLKRAYYTFFGLNAYYIEHAQFKKEIRFSF